MFSYSKKTNTNWSEVHHRIRIFALCIRIQEQVILLIIPLGNVPDQFRAPLHVRGGRYGGKVDQHALAADRVDANPGPVPDLVHVDPVDGVEDGHLHRCVIDPSGLNDAGAVALLGERPGKVGVPLQVMDVIGHTKHDVGMEQLGHDGLGPFERIGTSVEGIDERDVFVDERIVVLLLDVDRMGQGMLVPAMDLN